MSPHVKGRLPDFGETRRARRQATLQFLSGFGIATLGFAAWWLLSLALCAGCLTIHHEFDPVTVTIRTEFGVLNERPDGGR